MTVGRVLLPSAGLALSAFLGLCVAQLGPVALVLLPVVAGAGLVALRGVAVVAVAPQKLVLALAAVLPTLAASGQVLPGALGRFLVIAALAVALALMPGTSRIGRRALWSVTAYIGLLSLALARGWDAGALSSVGAAAATVLLLVLTAAFGLRLFTSGSVSDRSERALALALAPVVFVVANMIVNAVGDQLPLITMPDPSEGVAAGEPATTLVQLGFGGATRVSYPLAAGVNAFGIVAAAGIVTCTLVASQLRSTSPKLSIAYLLGSLICVAGVLTADSRTALAVALAVTGFALVRPRARSAGRLAILAPLAPVVLVVVLSALSTTQAADSLSRNSGDFATGTNRTKIWSAIINGTLAPLPPQSVIGWGANGQLTSGAFRDYAYIFASQKNQLYTAHDIYLQSILDIGYLGLAALVAVFAIAVTRLLASPVSVMPVFGWALIAIMLSGVTEAIPSYQFPETMALFILFITADAGVRRGGRMASDPSEDSSELAVAKRERGRFGIHPNSATTVDRKLK